MYTESTCVLRIMEGSKYWDFCEGTGYKINMLKKNVLILFLKTGTKELFLISAVPVFQHAQGKAHCFVLPLNTWHHPQ